MLVLLTRLAWPSRVADIAESSNRYPSAISSGFNWMIEYIYDTFSYLRDWRSLAVFVDRFGEFADAIHRRGSPLRNIIGFVDGKLQNVGRPGRNQGVLYSGMNRVHAIKWQGIMLPNGMMPYPFGPICGA